MERETKTINLQSGFQAEIITFWTWGERQEIAKILLDNTKIDLSGGEPKVSEVSAGFGIDLQKKTLELAVKKLTNSAGQEVQVNEIFNLPSEDVDFLLEEINKIGQSEIKKKL